MAQETPITMQEKVSFSIIVPFHNAATTLTRCVESLLAQQGPIQIVLVDDHSTDNGFDVCGELAARNKNILLLGSVGYGVSEARNTGLKHAKGDVIGFCDADDFYHPDTLRMVREQFLQGKGVDAVVVGIADLFTEKNESVEYTVRRSRYISSSSLMGMMCLNPAVMGSSCNKFYRSSLLQDITFEKSLSYCEDAHFNYRILSRYRNLRIYILNRSGYTYVVHSGSATENHSLAYNSNGSLKYTDAFNAILKECDLTRGERKVVKYKIAELSMDALLQPDRPKESERWLKADIRRYAPQYVSLSLFHNPVHAIKRMIKYLIYCVKEMA